MNVAELRRRQASFSAIPHQQLIGAAAGDVAAPVGKAQQRPLVQVWVWLSENCTILAPAPRSIVEVAASANGVEKVCKCPPVLKLPPAKIKFEPLLIALSAPIISVPLLIRVLPV